MAEHARLDILMESRILSGQEKEKLVQVNKELNTIWSLEEIKARQRAREKDIKEGDRNTKYFHVVANQRGKENTILSMDGPKGNVQSTEEIIKVATEYYKDLFKFEPKPNINIDEGFFMGEEKVC
jgi:hypothetical protein